MTFDALERLAFGAHVGARKVAHPRPGVVNARAGATRTPRPRARAKLAAVPVVPLAAPVSFVIHGPPITKKNSSRIARRKDGTPFILPSSQAATWAKVAIAELRRTFRGASITGPVNCRALVYRAKRHGDLVNYLQAIADALEEAGVVENDRLVVAWDGSRLLHDKHIPRVEIRLTPFVESE